VPEVRTRSDVHADGRHGADALRHLLDLREQAEGAETTDREMNGPGDEDEEDDAEEDPINTASPG
jgi:hypothetical protein